MRLSLLVFVVLAFCVGVGWRTVIDLSPVVSVWVLVVSLVLALLWRRGRFHQDSDRSYFMAASLGLLFLSLGIIRTEIYSWQFGVSQLAGNIGEEISVTGTIQGDPDYREKAVHLYIDTGEDKVLVTADRLNNFSYGDEVSVTGRLELPEEFTTDLGRTFDYPGYLKARGVEYKISFAEVERIGTGEGNPVIGFLLDTKGRFVKSIQSIIPEPAVGLGSGLLLGVKSALGEDIEEDFRRTGIIHIVVLSGYNVMLVVAFVLFCFSFFMTLRWRVVAGIISIAAFALLVGLSATVVRASIMASLVLLSQLLSRRYDVLRALLLAGVIMLLINPYLLIYDVGFQLSFMATLGLVLLIPKFESTVIEKGRSLGLEEFFLATIATQIAVLPLLMYHIGQVSLVAVLVNVLVLPIVPVAMFLTFLTGVVGFVSLPLGAMFGYLATWSLDYILIVAQRFGGLDFAAVEVPAFSAWWMMVSYGVMFVVWYYWRYVPTDTESSSLTDWTIDEERDELSGDRSDDVPVIFK